MKILKFIKKRKKLIVWTIAIVIIIADLLAINNVISLLSFPIINSYLMIIVLVGAFYLHKIAVSYFSSIVQSAIPLDMNKDISKKKITKFANDMIQIGSLIMVALIMANPFIYILNIIKSSASNQDIFILGFVFFFTAIISIITIYVIQKTQTELDKLIDEHNSYLKYGKQLTLF